MMHLVPVLRPDRTLLWLPNGMAERMQLTTGAQMTEAHLEDREVQALLASRVAANEAGARCTAAWHEQNGYL